MRRSLGKDDVADAIWGGSVLACGGGGWVHHGELMGDLATSVGVPVLASLDEVDDRDLVATVSAIGAPAAQGWEMQPGDYVRALQLLQGEVDRPIVAVMTAQNGSSTTLNGWIQSALTGVLVLDATGDVRAHPTGKQGGLGLGHRHGYRTTQVVYGGSRARNGGPLEVVAKGTVAATDDVLRDVSVHAGGFIASARNPVDAGWVREHAAIGAVSYALELGGAMRSAQADGADAVIDAVVKSTRGEVVAEGPLRIATPVRTEGGFDHGAFEVEGVRLSYLNEFMAADRAGERIATYPDVISVLSLRDGRPVAIADATDGLPVAVVVVDRDELPLSSSALDADALAEVEGIMGIPLLPQLQRSLGAQRRRTVSSSSGTAP